MKYSEKLYNRYKEEIESWDWIGVKTDALTNCFFDEENDQVIASTFIGTVFALAPSGKYYTFWTTNQTAKDVIRDEAFYNALNDVAESYDCWITSGEGDPCDLHLQFVPDLDRFKDHIMFVTGDEQEKYESSLEA